MEWVDLSQLLQLKILVVGHGGSSAGSYLADPISPIPSHCVVIILFKSVPASIVVTSTLNPVGGRPSRPGIAAESTAAATTAANGGLST